MTTLLIAFVLYALIFYAVCYVVTENAQNFLYNQPVQGMPWRVGIVALASAALATWLKPSFDTMFTSEWYWTLLAAVIWFTLFLLVLEFEVVHAAAVGLVTMVLIWGLAGLAVQGVTRSPEETARERNRRFVTQPDDPNRRNIRKSSSLPTFTPASKAEGQTNTNAAAKAAPSGS